jgi:lipoic acid synthetase
MSCSKIDPSLHQSQKPEWIKVRLPSNPVFFSTKGLVSDLKLHTVCESAQCPNRWECWSQGTATFMIAGDRCTRACGFCAVSTAKPFALEDDEPERVAEAIRRLKLKHVVITAVARDDLADGGALHFARTIEAIRAVDEAIVIEVLTPDFHGKDDQLQIVLDARPHVFNHNLETVERLTPLVRSRAKYRLSLKVLQRVKELDPNTVTKSGIMLGLGETEPEIFQAMDDLREANVQVLTIGQYLRPTPQHLPVVEYIRPEVFELYREIGYNKGFEHVASGPLVRSSYHAADYNPTKLKG